MISFTANNFRAVSTATIDLPGITVLSGPNGCGKSTISKLLYYILDTATRFDSIVSQDTGPKVNRRMGKALDLVLNFVFQLDDISNEDRRNLFPGAGAPRPLNWIADVRNFFNQFRPVLNNHPEEVRQFVHASEQAFGSDDSSFVWNTPFDVLNNFQSVFQKLFEDEKIVVFTRPLEVLVRRLFKSFEEPIELQTGDIECTIDESNLINRDVLRLNAPVGIKHVFYIDTPWVADWGDRPRIHGNTLDARLGHREHLAKTLRSIRFEEHMPLFDSIIHGSAQSERTDSGVRLQFTSDDFGKVFNLFHCATGIKAFSILQMLMDGGKLDNETILILDEPESNLHPQWIVEYARMIVHLHKTIGVRFLISTHSTDLVAAIQAISVKEEANGSVRFYLGETDGKDDKRYSFRPLGFDIAPIFDSFNKSLDSIARYGADVSDGDLNAENCR